MPETQQEHDLLIRLDERTEKMAEDLASVKKAINDCVKPELKKHEDKLAEHTTDIALLKNNWKVMVGVTAVVVSFVTWLADHLIPH